SNAKAGDFYDVRQFLTAGGQKGPQRKLLREGTHAINLAQFIVLTEDSTYAIQLSRQENGISDAVRKTIEDRREPVLECSSQHLEGEVAMTGRRRRSELTVLGCHHGFGYRLSGSKIQIAFLGETRRTIPRSRPASGRASRAGLVQDAACGTGAQRRLVLD